MLEKSHHVVKIRERIREGRREFCRETEMENYELARRACPRREKMIRLSTIEASRVRNETSICCTAVCLLVYKKEKNRERKRENARGPESVQPSRTRWNIYVYIYIYIYFCFVELLGCKDLTEEKEKKRKRIKNLLELYQQ